MPRPETPASAPAKVQNIRQIVRLAPGQCLTISLEKGCIVHIAEGEVALTGAPRWLAEQALPVSQRLSAGAACVIDEAGWYRMTSRDACQLQIMTPAARPGLWRLIKSRLGRSGLLLGNARPPDTQAAEQSVPHATSQ